MTKMTRRHLFGVAGAALLGGFFGGVDRVWAQSSDHKLIIVFAGGGWDTSMALDPKPGLMTVDVPDGDVRTFADIDLWTHASRPQTTSFFQDFASQTALVRGVQVRSIAHEECTKRIFTGSAKDTSADVGAMMAATLGAARPVPYMILGNTAFAGRFAAKTGRAGISSQLGTLLDPSQAYGLSNNRTHYRPPSNARDLINAFVQSRANKEAAAATAGMNIKAFEDYKTAHANSSALRSVADGFAARGFQLELLPQIDLGVRLLQEGMSQAILIEDESEWDTHAESDILQAYNHESLFAGLSYLMAKLEETNLLDSTTVLVISEMSRTPKMNDAMGKDHWPVTSALLMGAGVAGGMTYGATNDLVESVPVNFMTGLPDESGSGLTSSSFVAGVLDLVGADTSTLMPNVEPFRGFIA